MKFLRLASALFGLLHRTGTAAKEAHKNSAEHENPILNSIRFGSHFKTTGAPPASYNRKNQRKDRKAFRRKIAAGY